MAFPALKLVPPQEEVAVTKLRKAFHIAIGADEQQNWHLGFVKQYIGSREGWLLIEAAKRKQDGSQWIFFGCPPEETQQLSGMGYEIVPAPFFDEFCY